MPVWTPSVVQVAKRLRRRFMRLDEDERQMSILGCDNVAWRDVYEMANAIVSHDRILNERDIERRITRAARQR